MPSIDAPLDSDPLRDPALYFNRELSQLDFNFRVLAQAQDPAMPLLEHNMRCFLKGDTKSMRNIARAAA